MALNISGWFSRFFRINLDDWLVFVCSSYGRRMMEHPYDRFTQTAFFSELKKKPEGTKYLLEAINNSIFGFLNQKITGNSFVSRVFKEILMDASSELNRRLINGEPVKRILAEKAKESPSQEELNFLAALTFLDEKEILAIMENLISMEKEDRRETFELIKKMNPAIGLRFASLSPELISMIREATDTTPPAPPPKKKTGEEKLEYFKPLRKRFIKYLEEREAKCQNDTKK